MAHRLWLAEAALQPLQILPVAVELSVGIPQLDGNVVKLEGEDRWLECNSFLADRWIPETVLYKTGTMPPWRWGQQLQN